MVVLVSFVPIYMHVTQNTEIPFNPVASTVLIFLIDGWMNEYFDSQEPNLLYKIAFNLKS